MRTRARIRGDSVRLGNVAVTPLSDVRAVGLGAGRRGVALSRVVPKALEVREGSGPPQLVRIPDGGLWLRIAVVGAVLISIFARRRDD